MARGRMINRKVSTSGKVAAYGDELGGWGVVFHHRLIAFLDKNGNVRADPYWLKAEVMPRVAGVTPEDCRQFAAGLVEHGLAVPYEVDGMPYLHMPGFREEQVNLRADRESRDVPVPTGFDEQSGRFPDGCRQSAGKPPERIPPEVEVEGEVEVEDPPGVAPAREPSDQEVVEAEVIPDDDELPEVPADTGRRTAAPRQPEWLDLPFRDHDWEGRLSGAVVLQEWIRLQPTAPSRSDRDRFGRSCKQLADEHPTWELAFAFVGMNYLWPFGDPKTGQQLEAWTPEDLRRKFAKALPAARHHPEIQQATQHQQFERALAGGGPF